MEYEKKEERALRKGKKWLSLFLSASMLMSMATVTYADPAEVPSEEIVMESVQEESVDAEEAQIMEAQIMETQIEEAILMEESIESETDETVIPVAMDEEETKASVSVEDHKDGTIDLSMKDYTRGESVNKLYLAVWSQKDGQDDIQWYSAENDNTYKMDTKKHNDDLGLYHVHVYEQLTDGSMNFVCADTFTVTEINRAEPIITAADPTGDSTSFRLTLNNYEKPENISTLYAAVWSKENGQDDLTWYILSAQADGTYQYDVEVAKHQSTGLYYIHCYTRSTSGTMTLLATTSYEVAEANLTAEVKATNVNSEAGTCKITVKGLSSPLGISKVQIPVWSTSDQSDIYWYTAKKQSDGTYTTTVKTSNHKGNVGTYHVHAYATVADGKATFVGNTKVVFDAPAPVVTAEAATGKIKLQTKNIYTEKAVKAVSYDVWSDQNGKADLKTFNATYAEESRSAQYLLNLKEYSNTGLYHAECYAALSDDSKVLLGETTFNVDKIPTAELVITTDDSKGSFKITVKDLDSAYDVSNVRIPVWSKSDQSDIVWYTAKKASNGDYTVSSDFSKHAYNTGTYHAHVYVTDTAGKTALALNDKFTLTYSGSNVSVAKASDETQYTLKAINVPSGAKSVQFAVWSQKDGQDDIKWYTAKESGGAYTAVADIKNHKTTGLYYVHAYVQGSDGSMKNIGTTEFTVNCTATASFEITDRSGNDGFTVKVTLKDASSTIKTVKLPVWSKADQSDICWYTATATSAGNNTYTATVDVNVGNHKMNTGTYKVHCYAVFKNGIQTFTGGTNYTYEPPCVIGITASSNGSRTIALKNASSLSGAKFAVWSSDKGQDDIKWYTASKNSSGVWSATVKSANHKSSGLYYVHCYDSNNNFLGSITFNFAADEMLKNGWYYENGYKFYYKDGKKLTDLTSIIGAQSSYVAKVNRITCTITIYANDPSSNKGYIIPVKAFTCSVGLPATPTPAGTFYTFVKYRWKELMGPSWGQYATKFTSDGCYFHSVAGTNTTSYNLSSVDYNNLGVPASHGCVRLCVRDAKWIYDNCPLGMKVIVYDSNDPGPYGKPATIKIPAGQTWDPTDPAI